jgi:putative transposase
MPRHARIALPNVPVHLIQRGNNRQPCFFADEDYYHYLHLLYKYSVKFGYQIHAYVLMTNHVHLLISSECSDAGGALMKVLGQCYVQYVNRVHLRSGTLWEGRFRSCLVQEERYLLACQRYIEMNPVRANIVAHPADYRWSSYRANAQGEANALVHPHSLYEGLDANATARQAAYRNLFADELDRGFTDKIRNATNGNFALGDEYFAAQVAIMNGRSAVPGQSGRPRKVAEPVSGDLLF